MGGLGLFIHMGNGNVVRTKDVIAILDYQLILSSSIMEEMITEKRKQKKVIGPADEIKSVMITTNEIYYSTLSVSTLKKRSSMTSAINKWDDFSDEVVM